MLSAVVIQPYGQSSFPYLFSPVGKTGFRSLQIPLARSSPQRLHFLGLWRRNNPLAVIAAWSRGSSGMVGKSEAILPPTIDPLPHCFGRSKRLISDAILAMSSQLAAGFAGGSSSIGGGIFGNCTRARRPPPVLQNDRSTQFAMDVKSGQRPRWIKAHGSCNWSLDFVYR